MAEKNELLIHSPFIWSFCVNRNGDFNAHYPSALSTIIRARSVRHK